MTDIPAEVAVTITYARLADGIYWARQEEVQPAINALLTRVQELERQLAEAREDASDWMHDCQSADRRLAEVAARRPYEYFRYVFVDDGDEYGHWERCGESEATHALYAIDAALKDRP